MPIASSMHEAGYTKLVLWDNAEAWGRERGGEGFRMGGHLWLFDVDVWQNNHNITK